jgi:hypothetical protein
LIVYTQPHGSKDSIYIDSWLSQVLNISQQLIFKHMAMFKKSPWWHWLQAVPRFGGLLPLPALRGGLLLSLGLLRVV